MTFAWIIWKERNDRIFNSSFCSFSNLHFSIVSFISFWIGNLYLPIKRNVSSDVIYPTAFSYVSSLGRDYAATVYYVFDIDINHLGLDQSLETSVFPVVPSSIQVAASPSVDLRFQRTYIRHKRKRSEADGNLDVPCSSFSGFPTSLDWLASDLFLSAFSSLFFLFLVLIILLTSFSRVFGLYVWWCLSLLCFVNFVLFCFYNILWAGPFAPSFLSKKKSLIQKKDQVQLGITYF